LPFPEGKGDAKWRRASGRLFPGIDHTAIVVNDTESSPAPRQESGSAQTLEERGTKAREAGAAKGKRREM
jgi:hypothetical protein